MIDDGCGTNARSFPRRFAIIRLASIISTVKMLQHIQLIFITSRDESPITSYLVIQFI